MPYDPDKHHRRSIRLKGYDYSSAGFYFLTLCCYQRQYLFGSIVEGAMQLNELGQIVAEEWLKTPDLRPNFALDAWVVMPNHFHGIVIIRESYGAGELDGEESPVRAHRCAPHRSEGGGGEGAIAIGNPQAMGHAPVRAHGGAPHRQAHSVPSFVAGFKAAATKRINRHRNTPGTPVWQRNYFERIIRDERALASIQQYIHNNPATWHQDSLNSALHPVSTAGSPTSSLGQPPHHRRSESPHHRPSRRYRSLPPQAAES